MLIKTLKKFETLVLESPRGKIEIIVAERNGSQTVLHIYAPKSIIVSSDKNRQDQYLQLSQYNQPESGNYERKLIKNFASGVGRVDE